MTTGNRSHELRRAEQAMHDSLLQFATETFAPVYAAAEKLRSERDPSGVLSTRFDDSALIIALNLFITRQIANGEITGPRPGSPEWVSANRAAEVRSRRALAKSAEEAAAAAAEKESTSTEGEAAAGDTVDAVESSDSAEAPVEVATAAGTTTT